MSEEQKQELVDRMNTFEQAARNDETYGFDGTRRDLEEARLELYDWVVTQIEGGTP